MENNMEEEIKAKTYDFSKVKGISDKQLKEHYELYKGYVNNTNKIFKELNTLQDFTDANTTYSKIRSLMLGQSYAVDGVKLHQLYFENLSGNNNIPFGEVLALIKRDFGSYDRWEKLFKAAALSMRGWTVLAIDPIDGRLHIYGSDAHDVGSIWNACPILVLDVYEHAYFIDFGIDRKKYLEAFMKNIDWAVINKRIDECNKKLNRNRDKDLLWDFCPIYNNIYNRR